MSKFILGLILGCLLPPIGFYLYMISGLAPVATNEPPMPMEKFFAKTALHAKLEKSMPKTVPISADEQNLVAGAAVYKHSCSICHGLIGQPSSLAMGMFPRPPQLLEARGMVTDDPPGETFWKVQNGIRLSGMPSFRSSLSTNQMWQVSLMLAHADKLPSPATQALTSVQPSAAGSGK